MSDKSASIFAGVENNLQLNVISEKNTGLRILQEQVTYLTANVSTLQDELRSAKIELEEAKDDVEFYRNLLRQPLSNIAQKDASFKETYENQMEVLADWMVSQKAFKELAIELGIRLGLNAKDVKNIGMEKKLDVLENKHDPEHETNANDGKFLSTRAEKLITKIRKNNEK